MEEGRGSPPCELCSFPSPFYSLLYSSPPGVEMGNPRNIWTRVSTPECQMEREREIGREKRFEKDGEYRRQKRDKDERGSRKEEEEFLPKTVPSPVRFRKATAGRGAKCHRNLKTGRRKTDLPTGIIRVVIFLEYVVMLLSPFHPFSLSLPRSFLLSPPDNNCA